MKHDLYHLNNVVLWWHDLIHDNMSSRDIRDIRDLMSRRDFISTKLYTWLLLYVAVSELKRWLLLLSAITVSIVMIFITAIVRLRDFNAWPWNRRLRHGLRDFCYLCMHSSYRDDFFVVIRKVCRSRKSLRLIANTVTLTSDLESEGHDLHIRDFGNLNLYSSYSDDFLVVS